MAYLANLILHLHLHLHLHHGLPPPAAISAKRDLQSKQYRCQ